MKPLTREEIETYMREGSDAFINGQEQDSIPYSIHSDKGRLWLRGFVNSEYGTELVNNNGKIYKGT